jgi:serine/threonine-protein kinase
LVAEYLTGETASQVYARSPLSQNIALRQILTLLDVVEAIHMKDVIHRDISPSNILLVGERGIVLIDFGTSIVLRGDLSLWSSQIGRVVFKRGFSAPELMRQVSDVRCDIFSIGATWLYFLTGKSPAEFKDINDLTAEISPKTLELIRVAISQKPEDRFQSVREMTQAVERELTKTCPHTPTLTIGGLIYELKPGVVDVGRAHECHGDCRSQGHTKPIQVRIMDHQNFIEKHHARIWVDSNGRCSIEDLKSVNRTAVKHVQSTAFKVLAPSTQEPLQSGDIVALAYTPRRGPYVMFAFDDGRRRNHDDK